MVYSLLVHNDAKLDLAELEAVNEEAVDIIVAVLQEISTDQRLLDGLTIHDFGARRAEKIEVKKWWEFWKQGDDIWRLRVWGLEDIGAPYRIVYAYEPGRLRYHVLGIFHRDFDYNPSDPRTQRVKNAYDNL